MHARRNRHPLYGMVTAAALGLLLVGPALAQEDLEGSSSTTATVDAGDLTISDPANTVAFADKSITGVEQHTTGTLGTFNVIDMTGTNDGWQVSIEADAVVGNVNLYPIPEGSLSLTPGTVSEAIDNDWASATMVPTGAVDIDGEPVELASAAIDAGMGQHNFTVSPLDLTLPADILADVYDVDMTLTLAVGPSVAP